MNYDFLVHIHSKIIRDWVSLHGSAFSTTPKNNNCLSGDKKTSSRFGENIHKCISDEVLVLRPSIYNSNTQS